MLLHWEGTATTAAICLQLFRAYSDLSIQPLGWKLGGLSSISSTPADSHSVLTVPYFCICKMGTGMLALLAYCGISFPIGEHEKGAGLFFALYK